MGRQSPRAPGVTGNCGIEQPPMSIPRRRRCPPRLPLLDRHRIVHRRRHRSRHPRFRDLPPPRPDRRRRRAVRRRDVACGKGYPLRSFPVEHSSFGAGIPFERCGCGMLERTARWRSPLERHSRERDVPAGRQRHQQLDRVAGRASCRSLPAHVRRPQQERGVFLDGHDPQREQRVGAGHGARRRLLPDVRVPVDVRHAVVQRRPLRPGDVVCAGRRRRRRRLVGFGDSVAGRPHSPRHGRHVCRCAPGLRRDPLLGRVGIRCLIHRGDVSSRLCMNRRTSLFSFAHSLSFPPPVRPKAGSSPLACIVQTVSSISDA